MTISGTPSSGRAEKSPSANVSSFPRLPAKIELEAEVLERGEFGERLLRFEPVGDFFAALDRIGHMPLPPYIHRDDADADRERYQTVFSRERGSVAAPTAGLHFTPQMLDALTAKGVEIARVTLHVGLGTFAPLRVERVDDVHLHRERYTLSAATADAINRAVARRPAHRRRRHHGGSHPRTLRASGRRREHLQPHTGATEIFISPGFRIPPGRRAAHQLPSAAIEPADAGERLRRPRTRPRRLPPRRRGRSIASSATAIACSSCLIAAVPVLPC